MSGILVPKKTAEHPDVSFGVCVWELPNGGFVMDNEGNYFCAQGPLLNRNTEQKMRDAVKGLGITEGQPEWLPGFRKITQSEWEDQMERLQDGKVADVVDLYYQSRGNE